MLFRTHPYELRERYIIDINGLMGILSLTQACVTYVFNVCVRRVEG
jgi:hypothetical protein